MEGCGNFFLFYNLTITLPYEFACFGDNNRWTRKNGNAKEEGKSLRLTSYMIQGVRCSWERLNHYTANVENTLSS